MRMRITVGHLFILAGVGTFAAFNFSNGIDKDALMKKYSSVVDNASSLLDLFKSGAGSTPIMPASSPVPETSAVVEEPKDAVPPITTSAAPAVEETASVLDGEEKKEPVVIPAPVEKKSVRSRRSKRPSTKKGVKKPAVAKDPMIGTYVSMILDSGREVKGILEEKTATSYKIQMPGMGPFTYEASKVVSVKPAK